MTTNILKPTPTLHSDLFTWVPKNKVFSAEMSDLGFPAGKFLSMLGRAYNDACDQGFTFVSHWTGNSVTMVLDQMEIDEEGDLLFVRFKPAEKQFKDRFSVTVFND